MNAVDTVNLYEGSRSDPWMRLEEVGASRARVQVHKHAG